MKKTILTAISLFLVLSTLALAAQINSTSYKQNVIVSTAGENVSGTSYKMGIAMGIIAKVINSTSYINRLGFFHTWLLANGQSCTANNQCEGGYCCSNTCQSTACPSPGEERAGGGGGAAAGGGGGGGGRVPLPLEPKEEKVKEFSVSPSSIKEQVVLGAAKVKTIVIRNTGDDELNFDLEVLTISDFVFLSDSGFSLQPGEEKIVELNIIGKKLGSYPGELIVSAEGIEKSVILIIEVETEQVLFDAKMDVPLPYKQVKAGDDLKIQITLLSVGPPRKVDVTATYLIKDKRGNVVYESSETFAVEKQTSYVKSFKVPEYLEPGDYLAIVEVRYENSFAVSSEIFRVISKKSALQEIAKSNALSIILIISIGFVFLFVYLIAPRSKIFKK